MDTVIFLLFRHMKDPNQLLIIPITFWVGVEQGYFGADYTAVGNSALFSNCEIQYSGFIPEVLFLSGNNNFTLQLHSHICGNS